MNRQEIEQKLLARAREDATFRQTLLTNPHDALQQETGLEIPPGMELRVLEETPQRLCLVLPLPEDELSDLELAGVAGGFIKGQALKTSLELNQSAIEEAANNPRPAPSPAAPAAPSGGK